MVPPDPDSPDTVAGLVGGLNDQRYSNTRSPATRARRRVDSLEALGQNAPKKQMRIRVFYLAAVPAALFLSIGPFGARMEAQRNQPIYPAYDGYLKNPDGSYSLSFAYFSHNAEPVTIPPGNTNTFEPGPADRQQPTTFLPGHHRFQCIMVVPPDFDGKLLWTLTYAGTTTGTSRNMLQSNWNLVEGAEELRALDYAKAPRGVCLNRPPVVRVLGAAGRGRGRSAIPTVSGSISEELNLFGSVADEGLPRGGTLKANWKQLAGPGKVSFSNPDAARTRASFSVPGTYELELSASDSEFTSSTRLNVVIGAGR
jgi:hypothetical protein